MKQTEENKAAGAIVARTFRGSRLYLVSVDRAGAAFVWSSDRSKAQAFEPAAALAHAESAARLYAADCAAMDVRGQLLEPATVRARIDGRYTIAPEFCGQLGKKHVLRFCGAWLSWHETKAEAESARAKHAAARLALLMPAAESGA